MFGSFLNVCIYRMPRGLSVVRPRSACPNCEKPIAAYDNIPVLSWLLLRGRCRYCKARITSRYAIVELLTGGFFVLSFLLAGPAVEAAKYCVLSFLLIGLIFTDAETRLLPDLLTIPGTIAGLAFSWFVPVDRCLNSAHANVFAACGPARYFLAERWGLDLDDRILSLVNSLAGAIFGAAFLLGVALLYKALRGIEGMGMGDAKLMALIGAFLGMELTLFVILLASVIGSLFGIALMLVVWRKRLGRFRARNSGSANLVRARAWHSATLIFRNFQIPFGVFLGSAAVFAAFWGMSLIHWYMSFF